MASHQRNRRKSKRVAQKLLAFEVLEVRRLLASDWQNPGQERDVSRDLSVSPLDALLGMAGAVDDH